MHSQDSTTVFDLLRHGEPLGGSRFRGSLDDPLSERGWRQMREATAGEETWDRVLSSPLQRCQAFARALARERGIPLSLDPALQEIHFGDWEGRTGEEIERSDPGRLAAFWNNALENPPPGGETLTAFHQRVTGAWQHWRDALSGERVLLVCHGGVVRMILSAVLQSSPSAAMASLQVPYACRSRVRIDRSDYGVLSCLVQHGALPTPV
ncbi:MAG: histidine phosphatase family protein [Oleiphilaceae bacterium]|nr:histidine phosphatase family protein [Oleiphilaceae bacterium]